METTAEEKLDIKKILAKDILLFANDMNISKRAAINQISKNTKIGTATLERILDNSSKINPFPKTVSLIYSYIYDTHSFSDLMSKVDENIAKYIKESKFDIHNDESISNELETSEENAMTRDNIFNEIYLITSGEFDINIETIKDKFGSNGLKKVDLMLSKGYLKLTDENNLIRGKRKISWNRNTIINFANTLNNELINKEDFDLSPENLVYFYVGTCSEEDALSIKLKVKELFDFTRNVTSKKLTANEPKVKIALSSTMGAILRNDTKGLLQ